MRLLIIPLFLIFEIFASIKLADVIGAWGTLIWLVAALFLGINLLRMQGAMTMMNAAQEMRAGGRPGQAILDGVVKAFAAILLMVPGILSDVIAFILLIPVARRLIFRRLMSRWSVGSNFRTQGFTHRTRGNIYEHDGAVNDSASHSDPDRLPQDKPRKSDD